VIDIASDFHDRLQRIHLGIEPEEDSKLQWFIRHKLVEKTRHRYGLTMLGVYVMVELAQEIKNERAQSHGA
jgi:hypothetical protein